MYFNLVFGGGRIEWGKGANSFFLGGVADGKSIWIFISVSIIFKRLSFSHWLNLLSLWKSVDHKCLGLFLDLYCYIDLQFPALILMCGLIFCDFSYIG
jgi:hypothetical protein